MASSVHETEDNILRSCVAMLNKANVPSILLGRPTLPTLTVSDSGGSLAAGTYTYKAVALSILGLESQLSDISPDQATSGGSGSVAFAAATKVVGTPRSGSAYRIYRTISGVTKYYDITAATWEAGFTDTGATTYAGTTTTTVPLTTAGAARYAVLCDYVIDNLSTATNAGLQTAIAASSVHETEKNYLRQLGNMIQKMFDLKVGIDTPGVVSGGNITTATSGGTLTNATPYYFKFVAVDADGNLSIPSAEMTKTTGSGGAGNAHTITLKNLTQVPGAASYRIYVATTTATFTLGYFAVTKANLEGSTGGTYTGQALTAGTIPDGSTATGKVAIISDDDVAAAKAATAGAEFTTLRTAVTENARTADPNVPSTQDAGEQSIV